MITSALLSQSKEVDRNEAFYLQNSKLLKVELSHGNVKAQFGSMIAYQGDASFKKKGSGGIGKYIAKNLTGQGIIPSTFPVVEKSFSALEMPKCKSFT